MTASGETAWHGFGEAIVARERLNTVVTAIRSEDYPTAAQRPRNSRLDCTRLKTELGIELPHWREELAAVIALRDR